MEVMAKGCFNFRGWESNVPGRYISRSSGVTSLLGLLWDLDKDTLKCNLNYSGEGAQGELSDIDWEKILKLTTIQRIVRKFNPLTAAWWGGWCERLVRVLKELLRRTLGNAVLTTEELQTVLCDCESVINSRPLTYLSENSDNLVPLSPAMFLVENRNLDVADIDYRDTVNLRKRVRYRQKLLNDLRQIQKGVLRSPNSK
ncbi:integrase catalytic domain-containing protein [Trichonephila clavipes]|nr:integrase catalytic domain-containing protein [Trichonephila clavipes]